MYVRVKVEEREREREKCRKKERLDDSMIILSLPFFTFAKNLGEREKKKVLTPFISSLSLSNSLTHPSTSFSLHWYSSLFKINVSVDFVDQGESG